MLTSNWIRKGTMPPVFRNEFSALLNGEVIHTLILEVSPQTMNIGHDIVHIPRVTAFVRSHRPRTYIKRVFSRLEWPILYARFRRVHSLLALGTSDKSSSPGSNAFWQAVDLSAYWKATEDQMCLEHTCGDSRSALAQLSQFLAGRFVLNAPILGYIH